MFIFFTILATMALSTTHSKALDSDTKASSPYTNCGCQCSSLTFRDSAHVIQGNCQTVDSTGAQWCYVDSSHSSCQDLVPSQRFPHNPWSYEACATPALGSPLCPNYPAYPSHPTYHHPAAPTDVIVPAVGGGAFPLGPSLATGAIPLGPTVVGGALPLGPAVGGGAIPLGPAVGGGALPLGPNIGGGALPFGPTIGGGFLPGLGDARQNSNVVQVLVEGKGTLSGQKAPSK
eukprot:GFUD01045611.1.p1 GENE.GFUD01045611.1~~GFUD01045611.1.p1  ORF type:complete len:232 (-),score=83.46 GFUD01045611.1:74-769(-)